MKKSEVPASSEGEDDDTVLSLDGSFLSSHTEGDYELLPILDGSVLCTDMQQSSAEMMALFPTVTTTTQALPLDDHRPSSVDNGTLYSLGPPPIPKELELRDYTLWSRVELTKGRRFGPIPAQLKDSEPPSPTVWKVVDEHGTVKAWVDMLAARGGQWTAFLRASDKKESCNVCPIFYGGQIYLEVLSIIEPGQELRLSTYDLFLAHETSHKNGNTRSPSTERENGEREHKLNINISHSPSSSLKSPGQIQKSQHYQPPPLVPIQSSNGTLSPLKTPDTNNQCLPCDLDFADHYRLNEHIGNSHYSEDSGQGEREYKCPQCPKVFNWKSNLIRHQVAHDESRRYTCENCKKVFTDPSNLQRHIRSQHIGARSHACPECGKTFATSSGLKQHTHIHSSVKPFRCEVCFKAYTQFSNLCRHKRMHATCRMQIKCHKCGQAFSAVTSLSKHKRFCEGATAAASAASSANITNNSSATPASNCSSVSSSPGSISSQVQNSISGSTFEPGKAVSMSLAPPSNSLLFYPRTGFPIYPPSLFGYPLFSGPGLPAPPPLIPDTGLLTGHATSLNSNFAAVTQAAQNFQRQFLGNIPGTSPLSSQTFINQDGPSEKAPEKRHSIGSESEASEDLSSDTGGEDISSITDGESEADTKSPAPTSRTNCDVPSKEKSPVIDMFSNHRQGSPKQGSVCPDPTMIISPNGPHRPVLNNGTAKTDHDMPFDLSHNSKIRQSPDEASGFHPRPREGNKTEDQPLDLRVSHKKGFQILDVDDRHKAHIYRDPHKDFRSTPSNNQQIIPTHSESIPQMELPKAPESPPIPQSPTKLHMAYPRPIHPMFLESMYRLQQEKPAFNIFPGPERLMPPFPPRYPFLGPLLGTNPTFDFMRAHMEKVGKPMHEMMSPHLGKAKERYSCKFCGKIFPRSANLTRHLRTHTGEQPYKCKYCERSFSISSNLQRHVRNIHNKEKPFKCPMCDRCFGQQTNLDRHLKKHEADGPTILDDSPKAIEVDDKDETYFDEIRNFIGKVTNSGNHHMVSNPGLPMSLISPSCNDRKRDRDTIMMTSSSSLSPRQQPSPSSGGHSEENLDDETDGISPSDQDDESSSKKHRRISDNGSNPLRDSLSSAESNKSRSPDSTKDLSLRSSELKSHPVRNGDIRLNSNIHSLTYDAVMSLNKKHHLSNGIHQKTDIQRETSVEDGLHEDGEANDSSDEEIVDPVEDVDDIKSSPKSSSVKVD